MVFPEQKIAVLDGALLDLAPLAVAFSGGVDSTVLLHGARRVLGSGVRALIADSPSLPRSELAEARAMAANLEVELIEIPTRELGLDGYAENAGDRCYWCRRSLFEEMAQWARGHGFRHLAYGEITDDLEDIRPGRRAAKEFDVLSPLVEAGFTKLDVRAYARHFGLPVAEKPSQACLASRIPVGRRVTRERLARIEAAEASLSSFGFVVLRVRDLGRRARVEVGPEEVQGARTRAAAIRAQLHGFGFEDAEIAAYGTPRSQVSAERSEADRRESRVPGS